MSTVDIRSAHDIGSAHDIRLARDIGSAHGTRSAHDIRLARERDEPGPPPPPALAPWLEERLFDARIVLVQGPLDGPAASRVAAAMLTLDALGTDPVRLHVSAPDGELDAVFAVVDAIDMMRAPVQAVAVGEVGGAAIGLLAAAGQRLAYPHARLRLAEPRVRGVAGTADEITAAAGRYLRALEDLVLRLAAATGQPRSRIEDDLSAGRMLTAEQAKEYGLIQTVVAPGRP